MHRPHRALAPIVVVLVFGSVASAQITDFNTWTLVEDPANPSLDGTIDSASSIGLTASDATGTPPGFIPNATDIGYQSVNGLTAADSTSGFAFDPASSFSIAVDYSATFDGASGGLSFGFGIGEDALGMNGAGVGFVTQGGLPVAIPFAGPSAGAATVNDAAQAALLSPAVSSNASSLTGSFHIGYDAVSGDITVGRGDLGASSPSSLATLAGASVSDLWAGEALLASFFIRSDTVTVPLVGTVSTPWTDGTGTVQFTDLRVLSGEAFAVPTPGVFAGLGLFAMGGLRRRTR